MTLAVLLISLILERFLWRWQHLRKLPWFTQYRMRLFEFLPTAWQQGFQGAMILLLLPVLMMLILQNLLEGSAGGFWQLILSVLVLAYCLGLESFNDRVNDYLHACESHDRRQAKELAELLVGRPVPENIHQQTREVATAILYESNTRIFAVIFWFILLGPAGALLYRIAILLLRDSEDAGLAHLTQSAEKIFAWLDWAPTRLLSLSFFLTGSFDDALKAWKQVVLSELDMAESNRSIVINTGCGAMQHDVEEALMDDPLEGMLDEYDLHWVRAARALVIRSLVAWLAFVALMTIIALFTMFAAFI